MEELVTVEELLVRRHTYTGKVVSVFGRMMAGFSEITLVPLAVTSETWDRSPTIRIDSPGLENRCFAVLSPWAGGRFYYQDQAIVTGTFAMGTRPVLSNLSRLTLVREGRHHPVIPS